MVQIKKIQDTVWEIAKTGKMQVPGIVFASDSLMEKIKQDKTLEQVKNVACLPGIVSKSIAMSDAHQGYGFSIGGVAAFDKKKGIVSPGGVGYDINCGVRLLATNVSAGDIAKKMKPLLDDLYKRVPSGVGEKSTISFDLKEIKAILEQGAPWVVAKGYGVTEDVVKCEDEGCIAGADALKVSQKALARGRNQVGSLGAGNHFLEIQVIDEIYDAKIAKTFGLSAGQVCCMIHTGSRGLGHQVASDYIHKMEQEYGFKELPDRELACAPIDSILGKEYIAAMSAAANFAFANRQLITHHVRASFSKFFPESEVSLVYDIAHNIAKFEEFVIKGKKKTLCVHRKGATRSFGPGRSEIPKQYRKVGCPIFIPGSMGTYSYVLAGTNEAAELSFSSTAHGAGRIMSRSRAMQTLSAEKVQKELREYGVTLRGGSAKGMVQEAPQAYKDVSEVVRVSHEAGLGRMVARLKPIGVIKG